MPYWWSTHDFTDNDLELVPVWVCDTVHWPVPMTPLYATSLLPQPSWYWFNAAAQQVHLLDAATGYLAPA